MFEIEQKFTPNKQFEVYLEENTEFLGEKTITDTYYDDSNYSLTLKNFWLRKRNNRFQLKILNNTKRGGMDKTIEYEDENEIKRVIGYNPEKDFDEIFEKHNILPFCEYTTIRKKYKIDDITIDLDITTFDSHTIIIGEAEILVVSEDKVPAAKEKIDDFIKKYNLSTTETRSKLFDYIEIMKPKQYKVLTEAQIIPV